MASKSLGVLTLDLVAKTGGFVQGMDAAERKSEKWRKQVEKDAQAVGRGIGIAAAAVTAATAAMVVSTVKSANEISRLSQVSNVSAESFQRYAAGAKVVGIEQNKLSDIFKDTNDKIGDFMQTGAGPLADFFDQIAPQVGVTADMFRDLSGPDALQLYVSSLEKANVSQNDMTFYMEAIASDATLLLPLLRDNGAGFKLLGDEAQRAGAIMGEDMLSAADQLSAAMFVMDQATAGLKNQIAAELLPTIADLAVGLSDVTVNGAIAEDIGQVLSGTIKGLAATALGAFAAIQLLGKGLAGLALVNEAATKDATWYERIFPAAAIPRIYKNWGEIKKTFSVVGDDLDSTAQEYGDALSKIWNAGSESGGQENDSESRINKIAQYLEDARTAAGKAGGDFVALGKDFDKAGKEAEKTARDRESAAKKVIESIKNEVTALERAAEVWDMNTGEVKLYDLAEQGATKTQLKHAKALIETVDGFEKNKKAQEDYLSLVQDLRTDEEKLTDQMRERLAVLDAISGLSDKDYSESASRIAGAATEDAPDFAGLAPEVGGAFGEFSKLDDAESELDDWYAAQLDRLDNFRSKRADLSETWDAEELVVKQQHEDAMASIEQARRIAGVSAMGDYFGQLAVLRDSDSKRGREVGKKAAIAQATINAYTAATGAYASASAIPVVGWVLGPIAAAAALAAGLANVSTIQGQAHDGIMSVPNSGTWNLQKGERVTTANTSAALDKTLADIQMGQRSGYGNGGGGARNFTLNQTNNFKQPDNRTANQVAAASSRQQRKAARLG